MGADTCTDMRADMCIDMLVLKGQDVGGDDHIDCDGGPCLRAIRVARTASHRRRRRPRCRVAATWDQYIAIRH